MNTDETKRFVEPHVIPTEEDWVYEVNNGDTLLGYRDWVDHKIESENNKTKENTSWATHII